MQEQIAFIGGGNMARALIGGLINDGIDPGKVHVSDPNPDALKSLEQAFQVHTHNDNLAAVRDAQLLVLAVKPQVMKSVCDEIKEKLSSTIVLSIAAGIPTHSLADWLGERSIIRAMPNTPALVGSGATALYANTICNEQQKSLAESLMRAVGTTVWVEDEKLMDAVTALSGSGPAYFFYLMEIMIEQAQEMGLSRQQAELLIEQTAVGSAKLALESSESPSELRKGVTSPGGTTEAALKVFEKEKIQTIIAQAIQAARTRSEELAKLLGVPNE